MRNDKQMTNKKDDKMRNDKQMRSEKREGRE